MSDKQHFLVLLNELRKHTEKAEMFCWFVENSSNGENCSYAKKALDQFYDKQYSVVMELLHKLIAHE